MQKFNLYYIPNMIQITSLIIDYPNSRLNWENRIIKNGYLQ